MLTRITLRLIPVLFALFLAACDSGSDDLFGPGETPSADASPTPFVVVSPTVTPDPTTAVTVSGTVTYDFVPNGTGGGLDYDSVASRFVRGATVYALDNNDTPLAGTTTDAFGRYTLLVNENTQIRIRVVAELLEEGNPSWDFKVTDNTNGNAIYVLDGSLASVGTVDSTRDLHAASGWDGTAYSDRRAAAPFAILNNIYDALQLVLAADADVNLPAAELRWSINNTAISGDRSDGNIGTSFYDPSEDNMYILGDADNDTDEYDLSVILHEWAHYFEDTLSRSDSIGGSHTLDGAYDMRVAFGEGFANAFSSIVKGSPLYADSAGLGQARGFDFSLEDDSTGNAGWFSENSVGKIVYDIADENNEGSDSLSLGFTPIYQAMTSSAYVFSPAQTSIYLFNENMKNISNSVTDAGIDALVLDEDIFGSGIYGSGETNSLSDELEYILPVYRSLNPGGTVNICSGKTQGEYNGVDVRRFIRLSIASSARYTLRAEKTSGDGDTDPDFIIKDTASGSPTQFTFESQSVDVEEGSATLSAGEYVIEFYEYRNADDSFFTGGESCFDLSVNTGT